MITVSVSPGDDLQAVLDAAPENAVIRLAEGVYRQKLMIRTNGLTLAGAGAGKTLLVYDDHARKPHPIGWEYNTFRTYTLAVCADRVQIRDLTVANDALHPEIKGQEVASASAARISPWRTVCSPLPRIRSLWGHFRRISSGGTRDFWMTDSAGAMK